MADFLEDKKREIRTRMNELKPQVEEYQRLESAIAALDGVPANGTSTRSRAASPRRSAGTTRKASGSGAPSKRGRPRGSGIRSKQALEIVRARPGVTIAELAEAMKIKQNYLYRVMPALAKDGLVTKKGRGWHPKDAA